MRSDGATAGTLHSQKKDLDLQCGGRRTLVGAFGGQDRDLPSARGTPILSPYCPLLHRSRLRNLAQNQKWCQKSVAKYSRDVRNGLRLYTNLKFVISRFSLVLTKICRNRTEFWITNYTRGDLVENICSKSHITKPGYPSIE